MPTPAPHFVVTANHLREGAVLYRAPGPRWTALFAEAELLPDEASRDAALAWARGQASEVCGPYALDVHISASGERLLSQRERLRAAGAERVLERLRLTPPELSAKIARPA